MSLARRAIRRPVAVSMLWLAVVLAGTLSAGRLPIDLLPDLAYPRLNVAVTYPSVAPVEVERLVTEPVERALSTVPGVEGVESVSRDGASLTTVRFAWGTDMDFAALNVRETLDQLRGALPQSATRPLVLRTDPTAEPIMTVTLAGRVASDADVWALTNFADAVVKRRLEQINGVAQAVVTGGVQREIHVDVDPERLESVGMTIPDVAEALDAANYSAPGGTVVRGRYRYPLRTLGELTTAAQIGDVVVRRRPRPVRGSGREGLARVAAFDRGVAVRDLATVEDGFREREAMARYNGRPAVGLLVYKESGANTVRVTRRVDAVLAELGRAHPEVSLDVAASQAGFVAGAIANVAQEVVVGGILAFLVLFLFLRDPRVPVAIAVAIPVSLVATLALLDAAGASLNVMSLGGLALGVGLLMDNSIVVVENIFRHRQRGLAPPDAAVRGTDEVQGPVVASTLTNVAVFGPIVYVTGVAGELFGALSLAVALALGVSVLVSLTLVPTMAARWTTRERGAGGVLATFDRAFARFADWYARLLARALDHRGRTIAMSGTLLVLAAAVGLALDRGLLPDVEQGGFTVRIELPRGTQLGPTADVAERWDSVLRADRDVAAVFAHVGRREAAAGLTDDGSGPNTAALTVRLHGGARTERVLQRTRRRVADPPGATVTFETGRATALGQLLGTADADVGVRIRGDDLDAAAAYARHVARELGELSVLTNVRVSTGEGQPEVRVEVDRDRAASYGVTARRAAQAVDAYVGGVTATELVAFDQRTPVIVRLPEASRRSLGVLAQLRVDGVPLRELVTVREAAGPGEVRRIAQARATVVYADVAGGGLQGAIEEVRRVTETLPPPPGLRAEVGGENEEMRRSFAALGLAFGIALLLMYMILAAEFESLLQPLIVLLTVPLALIGAVLALWVTGTGLNAVSLIGVIVLVGIVDNDAVMKIDFINRRRCDGLGVRAAIMEAGHARLRPIVINSVTALLGLLPMALGIGPGAALQAPLAIAVLGGLVTATALTLVVIPVAYSLAEDLGARFRGVTAAVRFGVSR